jgi:CO/xanthine dehydrogenase FAD-binding subunit
MRRLAPHADTIVSLYKEGASFEDLALRFRCAASTVRRFLIAQDVLLRRPAPKRKLDAVEDELMKALRSGEDIKFIAKLFQVQPETVARYLVAKCAAISDKG